MPKAPGAEPECLAGRPALVSRFCPHMYADMVYGYVDAQGLGCPLHHLHFDANGDCIEQLNRCPKGVDGKERIGLRAYPVVEAHGVVWRWMGENPAPAPPRLFPEDEKIAVSRKLRRADENGCGELETAGPAGASQIGAGGNVRLRVPRDHETFYVYELGRT